MSVFNADKNTAYVELPRRRFNFLSVAELRAAPDPQWLVDELIEEKGLGVLYAASGGGKTFLTLDLACAIARGQSWFGLDVRSGVVVYIATEGNLKLRVCAYLHHNGLEPYDLDNLRTLQSAINLLEYQSAEIQELIVSLRQLQAETGQIVLVIIDTLNRAMPGGNENASEDMGAMVAAASLIKDALGCFVLYIHHSGKDEAKGSRGHSSLKAATDCEIRIEQMPDGTRVVHAEKVRDGEQRPLGAFTLTRVELGERNSCVVTPCDAPEKSKPSRDRMTAADKVALTAFRAVLDRSKRYASEQAIRNGARNGQTVADPEEWRAQFYASRPDDEKQGTKRQAFSRAAENLQGKGYVKVFNDEAWLC